MVASIGVRAVPGTLGCSRDRRFAVPRLWLAACGSLATLGDVRLTVQAVSLVKAGPAGAVGTTALAPLVKNGPRVLGGTEIDVGIIGTPAG